MVRKVCLPRFSDKLNFLEEYGGGEMVGVRTASVKRFAPNFPFLPPLVSAILLAWANAEKHGNAPCSSYFSMT